MTVRELAEALDVSVGTAQKIMQLPRFPDRERFKTEASFLRKVARLALKHDIAAGRITQLASRRKRASAPAGGRDSATESVPSKPGDAKIASDLFSFDESLRALRSTVMTLGQHMSRLRPDDPLLLPVSDRYQKLQGELRQSERQRMDLQERLGAIFARDDVYRSTSRLWIAFRATIDLIVTQLAEGPNLPTWIEETGGKLGADRRKFSALVRDRCYRLTSGAVNELADALADSTLPVELPAGASRECRESMAAELERVAAKLR